MKETYERTELEIFRFQAEDVITSSPKDEYEGWNPHDDAQSSNSEYEGSNPH